MNFSADVDLGKHTFTDGYMIFPVKNVSADYFSFNCLTHSYEDICHISCKDDRLNTIARMEVDKGEVVSLYHFWLLLIFMIIAWDGQAIIVSVGDTICFVILGRYVLLPMYVKYIF